MINGNIGRKQIFSLLFVINALVRGVTFRQNFAKPAVAGLRKLE